ncbi:MAG TPA: DUF87 domain-containing protein, partial [Thermoplasmata archaeon]|nr:DUF87 domain-containing protein [Thermoplasmata archaeon]
MSATAPVVRAWSFRSDGGRESPEESREFAGRLAECFRSTPIDRGGVDWAWESGPRARLVLASGAPALASWIARSLVPEYRTAQWTPVAAPPEDVDGRVGRVLDPFPHPDGPFRSVGEGSRSWIDPVIRLLPMLPPGIRVVWRLEPLGMPDPRGRPPIDGPLSPQPPGWRSANPPRIRRDLVDLREDRRLAFQWRVRGEVRFSPPGPDGDADPPGLWETLAAASRREGGCGFRARPAGGWLSRRGGRVLLSSSEVAALFPLPWSRFVPPLGTRSIGSRPLLVGSGTTLAEAAIWMDPREGRHLVVLGETGMGKSTLIVRLARQAVPHSSVVLFDPLGGTALRFLAALPAAARSRLLWIDPVRSPVGINALASVRSESSASQGTERVVDELVGALRRVRESRYSENRFWGPRIDEVAHRALRTAALLPGGTLADAERLLSGVSRLSHGIPTEARPEVEELRTLAREQPDQVDGTRRLFAEISRNRVLTRMLCARSSTTSIGRIVEPRGVTIITGASGAVGESTARYLLSVLFALVWTELQARPAPSKTVLVLDEAQWYAHGAAAEILRLGRDRNVHL